MKEGERMEGRKGDRKREREEREETHTASLRLRLSAGEVKEGNRTDANSRRH